MTKKLIYILLALLITSYSNKVYDITDPSDPSEVPDGKVKLSINISSGDFLKPVSKSAINESTFTAPYLMAFKIENIGSNIDTTLTEVVKTTHNGFQSYDAILNESASRHLLVFVANADSLVKHRLANHYIISKKYSEVMSLFTYGDPNNSKGLYGLPNPTTSIPFVNDPIPMWAKINVDKLEKGQVITNTCHLQRIVSKLYIDARKANTKNNFTLTGFTVLDVPTHAYIDNDGPENRYSPQLTINYGTASTGYGIIDGLIINNILNNSTESETDDRPIYVFPFRSKDNRGGVYNVIFSGHFENGVTRYYKLQLNSESARLIRQNVNYRINILSVQNNGYPTIEQAINEAPSTGTVYDVTVIDNVQDIIANKDYYLGLSNSEYLICDNGEKVSFTVATFTFDKSPESNLNLSTLTKTMTASGLGLTVNRIPQWTQGKVMEIKANLATNFKTGTIKITLGDITKTITITRLISDAFPTSYRFPNMTSADVVWESNENNYQVINNSLGYAYLKIPDNATPTKWVVRDPETLSETLSSPNDFSAEPIFTPKKGKGKIFDLTGLVGTTVIEINQTTPVYLGWFGGAGNKNNEETNGFSYSNRLVMEPSKGWSSLMVFETSSMTDKENGLANTKGMYELAAGDPERCPAAWRCWMKNDLDGDGNVTDSELTDKPWYLPAQKQLQAISIIYQSAANESYWCSTELSSSTGFIVNMYSARADYYGKNWGFNTKCVRDL